MEDLISRQAVLEILDRHTLSRMAEMEINDLPSVTPILKESPKNVNKDANKESIATEALKIVPYQDAISRSHFDERIRLAGGMANEELTQDFKDGVLTVLEMLKTEPSANISLKPLTCKEWCGYPNPKCPFLR